jgi:hypothetical protein
MAICGNCGAQSTRLRCRWSANGVQLPDECPHCTPQSFDKFKSVRDGQIAMAWEYDHKSYQFKDGVPILTDEARQDLEDAATKRSDDEIKAYEMAVERKRQERRTKAMSESEAKRLEEVIRKRFDESRESQRVN